MMKRSQWCPKRSTPRCRAAAPYELNPLNMNPFKDLLAGMVDFDRVRSCKKMDLFISATSVRTGKVSVFSREEQTRR